MAPGNAFEATSPFMAAAALREHEGPVLLVAHDVPALGAGHAAAALEDLSHGLDVVFAPSTDGSPFLLGLQGPDPGLLELLDDGFEALAAVAAARGGGIGMLRSERRLVLPSDARALAADPVAPEELLRHLRHAVDVRRAS